MSERRRAVRLRAQVDGDTLVGHAAVFGQVARVPGGFEQFAPGAFAGVIGRSDSDVVALLNHDMGLLLGRQSAGTLRLKEDGDGLAFEVDLPDTSYARDLRALIARGDVVGASVGYLPGATRDVRVRGQLVEEVTEVAVLRDVSPVTRPAYRGTDVSLRSADEVFGAGSSVLRDQVIRARHRARFGKGE